MISPNALYGKLTVFRQDSQGVSGCEIETMIRKLLRDVAMRLGLLGVTSKIDEDARLLHERRKTKRRDEEDARGRRDREERAEARDRKERQTEAFLLTWFLSNEYQRAIRELSHDVADAIAAIRLAHGRALLAEHNTRIALEEVQRNAITLRDGRRVYFASDGKLYGEDRREITDSLLIDDARTAARSTPKATKFEDYIEREDAFLAATRRVRQLSEALDGLDSITERLEAGDLSADELARLRRREQEIIGGLPMDVSADYDRLREARRDGTAPAYRALDPATEDALNLTAHFTRADDPSASQEKKADSDPIPNRQPAYKSVPDF